MSPEEPDVVGEDDGREPRVWWWTAHRRLTTAGLVVLAAIVATVVVVAGRHQPATAAPRPTAAAAPVVSVTNAQSAKRVIPLFAAGTAADAGWTLEAQDVATGHSCLPGVEWTGQIADVLFPGTNLGMTPAGAPSVLTGVPQSSPTALPGASFAFFQVPAAVRELRVAIGGAAPLTVFAHDESPCGTGTFRVAGFGFPSAARVTVTAITAHGESAPYTLPYSLVHPAPRTPGYLAWQNLGPVHRMGPPRPIATADVDGARWEMSVGISSDGECFHLTRNGQLRLPVLCRPISLTDESEPINGVMLPGLHGYFLSVTDGTVHRVTATLPGGKTVSATPVDVYGFLLAGLFTGDATPTKFTFYRAGGSEINSMPWEPAPVKSKA
jgi:hypothetical protein